MVLGLGVGLLTFFWLARFAILIEQPDAHPLFCVSRFGFGLQGLGFRVWGLGCRVWGLRFEVGGQGLVYRVVNIVWV